MISDGSVGPDLSKFEYKLDTTPDDSMVNWFVTMDLMCYSPLKYLSMLSWFFVGYGIGIILFFLPDLLGRRYMMMRCLIPVNLWVMYVGTFSKNLELIKIASFVHGFFHIKNTLCYTHNVELVPDKYKTLVCTCINAFNCSEYMVLGIFYQFIEPNTDKLLILYFLIGILACILYMAFIPESPFWLIVNEGENSQKAISNLNYIAMFNGSSYRIPTDTLIALKETTDGD